MLASLTSTCGFSAGISCSTASVSLVIGFSIISLSTGGSLSSFCSFSAEAIANFAPLAPPKICTKTLVFLPFITPVITAKPTSEYLLFKMFFLCVSESIKALCAVCAEVKFIAKFSPTNR